MPGEIGASMFSPRPARGYRFHSLQVVIIAFPLSGIVGRQQFESNARSKTADLTASSTPYWEISSKPHKPAKSISPRLGRVTAGGDYSPLIVAECCKSVSLFVADRSDLGDYHEIATAPVGRNRPLAGFPAREEDQPLPKNIREETPCRARLRSTRSCVKNATRRKYRAWSPWPRTARR